MYPRSLLLMRRFRIATVVHVAVKLLPAPAGRCWDATTLSSQSTLLDQGTSM